MIVRIASQSTVDILTVAEVKDHLRIDSTHEDELLKGMIITARELAENKTRRSLIRKQYELILDDFPASTDAISLPYPPLSTASTDVLISYLDETSGDSTSLSATAYTVDWKNEPGRVYPSYDNEWPDDIRDVRNAVSITYYSGYSTTPEPVKTWMKLQIGAMYENREAITPGNQGKLSRTFYDGLLDGFILPEVY